MSQKSLNAIKLYVAGRMTTIQDEHAKLIAALQDHLGSTREYDDSLRVLNKIYDAQIKLLEDIFKELSK